MAVQLARLREVLAVVKEAWFVGTCYILGSGVLRLGPSLPSMPPGEVALAFCRSLDVLH